MCKYKFSSRICNGIYCIMYHFNVTWSTLRGVVSFCAVFTNNTLVVGLSSNPILVYDLCTFHVQNFWSPESIRTEMENMSVCQFSSKIHQI